MDENFYSALNLEERAKGYIIGLMAVVAALVVLNYLHAHTVIGFYVPYTAILLVVAGGLGLVLQRLPLQQPVDTFWPWAGIAFGTGIAAISLLQHL
jgi:hypothetical protein